MKNVINLYNRDGAKLQLIKGRKIDSNTNEWNLTVDEAHSYVLEYSRIIGDYPKTIEGIDPSGGPMLSLGEIIREKYKIINIINPTTFWLSERNNN